MSDPITVYVFVTGLALMQANHERISILLPNGHHEFRDIDHYEHLTRLEVLTPTKPVRQDELMAKTLTLSSTEGQPAELPATVIDLRALDATATLSDDCKGPNDACRKRLAGEIVLRGEWRSESRKLCPVPLGQPDPVLPEALSGPPTALNFLSSTKPWQRRFDRYKAFADAKVVATNSVQFSGSMTATDRKAITDVLPTAVLTAQVCAKYLKVEKHAGPCMILNILNGEPLDGPFNHLLGAADPHFAAYYSLLQKAPATIWLPVAVGPEHCDYVVSGGGNVGAGCAPVRVP